eukprot:3217286-Rhodomonas_salina.2
MSSYSNSATLDLPESLSRLHPTFNVLLFKPYIERDTSLGPSAHPHPLPVISDATGQYYLIERIVAESRSTAEPIYIIKWVGYPHSDNTQATHSFLIQKSGGRTAIAAWQSRLAAIPTPAVKDRAAKHLYSSPRSPSPSLLPLPAPLLPHAPHAPHAPAPPPPLPPPPPAAPPVPVPPRQSPRPSPPSPPSQPRPSRPCPPAPS